MARLSKIASAEAISPHTSEPIDGIDPLVSAELNLLSLDHLVKDTEALVHAEDADDERRESAMTTTSISSFPDSAVLSDNDLLTPILNLYSPPSQRSNYKWLGSRAERASPSPSGSRSPRRAKLHHARSRTGTPRSIGRIDFKGSPRPHRRISEATEALTEVEENQYPLVLLHVTLLPVTLPWSNESVSNLLPANVLENLRQLKAKASETVLSRGILISHPREEYDLLEDRLLEALELKEERLTKCGHFRNRSSVSSASDSDSGVGSSIDGSDNELCAICQHHIRPTKAPVGGRDRKWSIKVFAANGLLRPPSWAAAWADMEAVDVEILPWIEEDLRRKLDEAALEEELEARRRWEDEEEQMRLRAIAEEQTEQCMNSGFAVPDEVDRHVTLWEPEMPDQGRLQAPDQQPLPQAPIRDIPNIYEPSQIPLSVLLQNYIYLLLRDWRNVAIVALATVSIFLFFHLLDSSKNTIDFSANTDTLSGLPTSVHSNLTVQPLLGTEEPRDGPSLPMGMQTGDTASLKETMITQNLEAGLEGTSMVDSAAAIFGLRLDDDWCLVT